MSHVLWINVFADRDGVQRNGAAYLDRADAVSAMGPVRAVIAGVRAVCRLKVTLKATTR